MAALAELPTAPERQAAALSAVAAAWQTRAVAGRGRSVERAATRVRASSWGTALDRRRRRATPPARRMPTAPARLRCVETSRTAAPVFVALASRPRGRAPTTRRVPMGSVVRSRIPARVRLAWANAPPHAQRPAARPTSSAQALGIACRNRAPPVGLAPRTIAALRPERPERPAQIRMAARPCPALKATLARAAAPVVPM